MNTIMESAVTFFIENFPSPGMLLVGGPLGLAWAFSCLYFAGRLKRDARLKTGYTRKIFHFLIFVSVAFLHGVCGSRAVCLFGGMATLVIFYAVFRGSGHLLYEAMAREKDEPRRTYYIVVPYFATLLGGLTSNILFGHAAVFGYLVAGLGDAIGEPVGTRFGRHPYRVPSFGGVSCTRTLEGSAAVFAACLLAIAVGIAWSPGQVWVPSLLRILPLLAAVCAVLEAVSPHGWDNAVLQVVPSFLAVVFLKGV